MQVKIVKDEFEIEKIKEQWMELQKSMSHVCFYDTYEYFEAWYSSNKNRFCPYIICILNANRFIGLAPLVTHYHPRRGILGLRNRTLGFIEKGDFHNFLISDNENAYSVIKKIFNVIEKNEQDWDRLILARVNPLGTLGNYIQTNNKYINKFIHKYVCPYINIEHCKKEDYLELFPRRKSIKQYAKALKKKTDYCLEVCKGGGEELLGKIASVHKKEKEYLIKEKGRTERVCHFETEDRKYIEKIYLSDNNEENIISFFLKANSGEIIAYITCYHYNKILHLWNMAYNPEYSKYSPTCALLLEVIIYLFNEREFDGYVLDLGSGNYTWKHEFTDTSIYNFTLNYIRPGCKHEKFWNLVYDAFDMREMIRLRYRNK